MGVERDIAGLSFSFAAGIVTAAYLLPYTGFGIYASALAASTASALLIAALCSRKGGRLTAMALFFFLGTMCFLSSTLNGPVPGSSIGCGLKDGFQMKFTALLSSIGFGDERTAPLLCALLAGDKSGLGKEIASAFRQSGASHILALSGLHLGVIYGISVKVLSLLGNSRPACIARSAMCILLSAAYTIFTGASPSLVRAFLFILINETARHFPGRKKSPISVFCIALTIQLASNPMIISSAGFQLSYLAMSGIFFLFPIMKEWYPSDGGFADRINIPKKIWNATALSLSCQLFTAPVVWIHFHSFPAFFLLANLIALPLTELLIVSAVITVALSPFSGTLPDLSASITDALAGNLLWCIGLISGLSP